MPRQAREVSASSTTTVAKNLRIAQAVAQVSNLDLAAAVDVSPRTVGKWRRGEIEITLTSLDRLAGVLGRDVAWFLADHGLEDVAA